MSEIDYYTKCGFIKPQCQCEKPMTNADAIRNMTDEELAEFFHNFQTNCECCIPNMITKEDSEFCDGECKSGILIWLQAEVGDEDGNDE